MSLWEKKLYSLELLFCNITMLVNDKDTNEITNINEALGPGESSTLATSLLATVSFHMSEECFPAWAWI